MPQGEQKASIASLKATLFEQIEGQEFNEMLYTKILKRLSFISVFLAMAVLGGMFLIIFNLSQPSSILAKTIQAKRDLDTINSLQFRIMKLNTRMIVMNSVKIDSLEKKGKDEKVKP